MSSNLKVNTILPSTGSNVAIGTAGGTVTMVGNVDIDINSGISTFNDIHVSDKIVHDGDTNTSLRFPAADTITAETSGSERLRIDSSGQMGLGTNNPVQQAGRGLHINGTDQTRIKLTNSNSGATANDGFDIIQENDSEIHILNHENAAIKFGTNDAERLRITSGGLVGIGTNSPKLPLHVHQENSNASFAHFTNTTTGVNANQGVSFGLDSNEDATIYHYGSKAIRFATGGTEKARITSDGYFKLGSTDGGAWHTIRLNTTTNNAIKDVLNIHSSVDSATAAAGFGVRLNFFGEQLNGNEYIYGSIAGLLNSTGSNYGDLAFYTNNNGTNTERLRITSVGKVGINTSSPTNVFTIHHNDNNQFAIKSGDANADIVLADSGGSSRLRHSNSQFEVWTGGVAGSYYAQNSVRRLAVTSSGYLQKLNNPSFRAGLSANTTFNSSTDIIFNDTGSTWHYNLGNHYNTSNGRFTAPVSGVYQFNACVIWYGAQNNTFMGDAFLFIVNGGNSCYSGRRAYYNTGTTGNSLYYTDHMSVNLYLNATDYITVRNNSPVATVHGNTYYTWFAGTFLG